MEKIDTKSVESMANYEGNATILLLERTQNPVIRAQILDLLLRNEKSKEGTFLDVVETKDGKMIKDEKGDPILKKVPCVPASREELEEQVDNFIEQAATSTGISFNSNPHASHNHETMEMNFIAPWNGKLLNEKQMSIAEAHEKGHLIRDYDGPLFETYFKNALHFDPAAITDEDVEFFRKGMDEEDKEKPSDYIRETYIQYMSRAKEIAERMSQLKNYFGMSGDDVFTREHLQYAREHYVKNTDLDNGMRVFFEAIKPETEEEFIRLINCSGI